MSVSDVSGQHTRPSLRQVKSMSNTPYVPNILSRDHLPLPCRSHMTQAYLSLRGRTASFTPQSTEHNKLKKVCPKAARAAGRLCSPGVGSFTETEKEKLTGRRTYCRGCKTTALTDFLWFVSVTLVFPATRSHNRIVVSWLPVMRRHARTERQRQTDMGRIHKLEYSKHDVLLCTHTH